MILIITITITLRTTQNKDNPMKQRNSLLEMWNKRYTKESEYDDKPKKMKLKKHISQKVLCILEYNSKLIKMSLFYKYLALAIKDYLVKYLIFFYSKVYQIIN